MDKDVPWPQGDEEETVQYDLLRQQSRTYYELEQLVTAVSALSAWVLQERPYTRDPARAGPAPSELKQAKIALDEAMQPLLSGILRTAKDHEEAADLEQIRKTYIPEIIIAYNTALYTAGPTITRDSYVDAMDLSVAVASEASGLTEPFMKSNRMRELVTSLAQTSKQMLIMKASGRPWKSPKEKAGKDLGIWEIGPQGHSSLSAGADEVDVS
jgi:nuclear pore complex protein Nup107